MLHRLWSSARCMFRNCMFRSRLWSRNAMCFRSRTELESTNAGNPCDPALSVFASKCLGNVMPERLLFVISDCWLRSHFSLWFLFGFCFGCVFFLFFLCCFWFAWLVFCRDGLLDCTQVLYQFTFEASQSADGHVYALKNPCSIICNMQLNVLNDLAEAMKALDGKKSDTRLGVAMETKVSEPNQAPLQAFSLLYSSLQTSFLLWQSLSKKLEKAFCCDRALCIDPSGQKSV